MMPHPVEEGPANSVSAKSRGLFEWSVGGDCAPSIGEAERHCVISLARLYT